jgi:hypothetical protein
MKSKPIDLPEIPHKISKKAGKHLRQWSEMEGRHLYRDLQQMRAEEWRRRVLAFEANPDFYNAWHYLHHHPLFWTFGGLAEDGPYIHERYLHAEHGFPECLSICPVKVNPATGEISPDPSLNTRLEIWYELSFTTWGARYSDPRVHVYEADGGAATYEEAVIKAAKWVHKRYGNDRQEFDKEGTE